MKIYFIIQLFLFTNAFKQEEEEKPINIKVIPSKNNKLTIDDLDEIRMEVLHDMNVQLRDLEDEMADKERLKEKTSSTWSITVFIYFFIFFRELLCICREILLNRVI